MYDCWKPNHNTCHAIGKSDILKKLLRPPNGSRFKHCTANKTIQHQETKSRKTGL